MLTEIKMPKIGFTMEEGTIGKWLKQEGEQVNKGEPLLEILSDKASVEIEAPTSGLLHKILDVEGAIVPVMKVIGYIGNPDDALPTDNVVLPANDEALPIVIEKPRLSPRARKFANENSISAEQIPTTRGTGVNGMIVERDLKALSNANAKESSAGEMITPSQIRQVTAKRLTQSIQEIPQFVTGVDVDASALLNFKERFSGRKENAKVSVTCLLIKCVAKAIRENMNVNVSWSNGRIAVFKDINIGIAIATGNGLVVPVIREPDKKGVFEIASELNRLMEKAKEGKLTSSDTSGGTFTISNLGMFEVDSFQAVINPPESGILAVGRINKRPVVAANGEIIAKPMMWLNLTSDHRVLDGADAARLLGGIKLYIEFPEMLIG